MKAGPLVSVIMPAYNAAAVLPEALASAAGQTHGNLQILVVDDGSQDGTGEVAELFSKGDARCRVIRQKNGGVSAARNAALREATGEWIAFLDADDVWFPGKIARQLELAAAHPEANLIFTNYFIWDGVKDLGLRYREDKPLPGGDLRRDLVRWNLFGMSSVMVRREAVECGGGFDERLSHGEDWDLWLRIAEQEMKAVGVREPWLRYRVWGQNASRQLVREAECVVELLEKAVERAVAPGRAGWCEKFRRRARGKLELARLRAMGGPSAADIRKALWLAWKASPGNWKWLAWMFAARLPDWLGGKGCRRRILGHLRR